MAEHNELGKQGEALAMAFLKKKGYQILLQNWRYEKFEVDIIATHDKNLIFVEVKTRFSDAFGHPASFLGKAQQLHLAEAAEAYIFLHPEYTMDIRYDIVSVILQGKKYSIEHIEDAFWPDNLGLFSMEW